VSSPPPHGWYELLEERVGDISGALRSDNRQAHVVRRFRQLETEETATLLFLVDHLADPCSDIRCEPELET
jgi:hypothetical protein